jgi:hypothetical protein
MKVVPGSGLRVKNSHSSSLPSTWNTELATRTMGCRKIELQAQREMGRENSRPLRGPLNRLVELEAFFLEDLETGIYDLGFVQTTLLLGYLL